MARQIAGLQLPYGDNCRLPRLPCVVTQLPLHRTEIGVANIAGCQLTQPFEAGGANGVAGVREPRQEISERLGGRQNQAG